MNKEIDWEQRRYEIAKAAATGIITDRYATVQAMAQYAIKFADALIDELKKTSK